MHGSFSRADTWNFMAMQGPDFKSHFVDPAPASNADVGRTIAHLLRLDVQRQRQARRPRAVGSDAERRAARRSTSRVVISEPARQRARDRHQHADGRRDPLFRRRRISRPHGRLVGDGAAQSARAERGITSAGGRGRGAGPRRRSSRESATSTSSKPAGNRGARPARLRHDDLRMRDHGGERFDGRVVLVCRSFIGASGTLRQQRQKRAVPSNEPLPEAKQRVNWRGGPPKGGDAAKSGHDRWPYQASVRQRPA